MLGHILKTAAQGGAQLVAKGAKEGAGRAAQAVGADTPARAIGLGLTTGALAGGVGLVAQDMMDNSDAEPTLQRVGGNKYAYSIHKDSAYAPEFVKKLSAFGEPMEDENGNITFILSAAQMHRINPSLAG